MRYYLALFFALLLCGCGKDTVENKEPGKCQLTSITRLDHTYPLMYEGTRIVQVGNGSQYGTRLTYGANGKLTRVESPVENPYYRTDLFYNDEGKVYLEKKYEKSGGNWVEEQILFYTYTNGKVTGIKENFQRTAPALEYHHEVIWEGDNIRTIIIRSGTTIVCTQQFSYDMTQKNPITALIDLYYCDNIGPSYKLALYSSANRLIKEENSCRTPQATNLTYDFNDKNLPQTIYTNGYKLLSYEYNCP